MPRDGELMPTVKTHGGNRESGTYYKKRTKEWFLKQGYICEFVERFHWIFAAGGKMIPIKRDLFASDGIAICKEHIVFWNSILTKHNLKAHVDEYKKWPFPKTVELYVIVWEKGARHPEVIDARTYGRTKD